HHPHYPPGHHADPGDDDDHVPLGAMAPAYPPGPGAHQMQMQMQLELELEQQQLQFQQQYLQQYHQYPAHYAEHCADQYPAHYAEHCADQYPAHYAEHCAMPPPSHLHALPQARPPPPRTRPWVKSTRRPAHAASPHAHAPASPAPSSSSDDSEEADSSDESAFGINPDEETPLAAANADTPILRNVSTVRRHRAASVASSSGGEEDDDDVPLSIISSGSTHNSAVRAAAVRRAKTVAPAALSPRSGPKDAAAPLPAARGLVKARSLHVRPPSASSSGYSGQSAGDESDEDAPLDKLKAELESGVRLAPSTLASTEESAVVAPRASSLRSLQQQPETAASATVDAQTHNDGCHNEEPGTSCSIHSSVDIDSASTKSHASQSDHASPQQKQRQQSEDEDQPEQVHKSPVSSAARSVSSRASSGHPSPTATRAKKTAGYLPTGTALPGLPVKQRKTKPRAAVQYVALAEIAENAERSQQRPKGKDSSVDDDSQPHQQNSGSARPDDGASAGVHSDGKSVASFATASSSGGTMMEVLRNGPIELLTASTDHSGSKAAFDRVVPEDYGDIDQLLVDLDGIMSGSLAARRRFSLALMRRSLAIENGLVEPCDYTEHPAEEMPWADTDNADARSNMDALSMPVLEFKPLEIADVGAEPDHSLGMDDMLFAGAPAAVDGDSDGANKRTNANEHDDEDTRPLNLLAAKHPSPTVHGDPWGLLSSAVGAGVGMQDSVPTARLEAAASGMPPQLELNLDGESPEVQVSHPVELTRTQKIHKALEKLDLMGVRKVSIRIYVQDARRYYTFSLTEFTTSEMIINDMKKSGIIDVERSNWALFELVDYFGIERPLNHFENLVSVVESWEPRSNNYIIAKGFTQQAALTLLGGVHAGEHAIQGMLYYRVKKNKWQKGVFRLQGHNMLFVKDGRGKAKKETHYLTLANNDVYTPFEPLRGAPTRYVFGLKSEMPMQMFEKPDEDYVKWFAVQTLDSLRQWLQTFRFSKNQIKFCHLLERRVVESSKAKPGEPNAPLKPLVDLAADKHDEDAPSGAEPGRRSADIAAGIVSDLGRTAVATKHDPAALLAVVGQKGIDVSDFSVLGSEAGAGAGGKSGDGSGGDDDGEENADNMFQPGSLLSKPKKAAIDQDAAPDEADMFVKGSLLSQPRESKALAASRAMQSIMAQNGNVFTQGSLLQVTDATKPRPPHIGGAATNVPPAQFPLVQLASPDVAGGHYPAYAAPPQPPQQHLAQHPEDTPVFGGLLAAHDQNGAHASPYVGSYHPHAHQTY
ncbi:hypothetical protein GGF46_004444, partial [Coemansia sp. RSA 552]